jgi:uncharacterized protein YutE (UPF0331/DUF86 family)
MSDHARPPVTVEARLKAVQQVLAQLARTMEQLEIATSAFSPDFDPRAFADAWQSKSPKRRNQAMLVRSNMDDLHNLCQALIDRSARVAQDLGSIPADRKTPAADQLRGLGLYPREAQLVMQEVIDLRNTSQHAYWILLPDEVHAAVNHQRQCLPSFVAAVGAWIEGLTAA